MKKKLIIIVISLLLILGIGYLGINIYMDSLINKTSKEEEVVPQDEIIEVVEDETPKAHEVVNIMLVGADNLDYAGGRENSYVQERSDVFKIVSLDYTDKTIKLTSLDRDIVVWIPDRNEVGDFGRFNWAYSFGGAKFALNCINYNLDLDVSKYVSFSFKGFIDVIDIIGGIDIELTQAEADFINNPANYSLMSYPVSAGINHLNGKSALTYARIRHLDSDFVRMERQNTVIKAVINKLKTSSFTELMEVINKCLPYITTNLTNSEIKTMLWDVLSFDLNDIQTQTFPINGTEDVAWNHSELGGYILRSYSNQVIELHKYIYGTDTYEPTKRIYDNENKIYETYGQFYENSELIP